MCSFNPYQTTAEMHAEILRRHEQETAGQAEDACTEHEIVSTPNGQSYGERGHIPCDHVAVFHYPAHIGKISTFDKNGWHHHPA